MDINKEVKMEDIIIGIIVYIFLILIVTILLGEKCPLKKAKPMSTPDVNIAPPHINNNYEDAVNESDINGGLQRNDVAHHTPPSVTTIQPGWNNDVAI